MGQPASDFTLPDVTGKPVNLSDLKGKVIVLSFWSCYTDTCFTTVGVFEQLLVRLGPSGLVAPTVCEEVSPQLAADGYAGLLKRCSTGQTILIDEKREVRLRYRVRQLPTSIIIGPDFTIREIIRGVPALRDPALFSRLEELVKQAAAPPGPASPKQP
jgi:peroxiredoxin